MKEKMLWNVWKDKSVKASKIREFAINPYGEKWQLRGWFNNHDDFLFGVFDSYEEAREFLEEIHKKIEE